MKIFTISMLLFFACNLFAQEKLYKYDKPITCEDIHQGIIDSKLYKYEDGRLVIVAEEWRKNEMKKLLVENKIYYVSNKLATLIKKCYERKNVKGLKFIH